MTKQKTPLPPQPAAIGNASLEKPDRATAISFAAVRPSINAAIVTHAYQGNLLGDEVQVDLLVDALLAHMEEIKDGDLSKLEAMLYAQASALQTMFASLARRAHGQEYLKQYGTYMTFALKAQAQSRATIQTLVELKFPRQVAFVKQANISNGHQQVNNGAPPQTASHANDSEAKLKNELLEAPDGKFSKGLDFGAPTKAARGHSKVEAVGKGNGAAKRSR